MGAWRCRGRDLPVGGRTLIMGILNVTPDSFSDGGRYAAREAAVARGLEMVAEGADLIDVGGESTRPGAAPVSAEEEIRRVVPVIEALHARADATISIDTTKAVVADAALAAGAHVVNDVSGATLDPKILEVAQRHGAGVVLMHMRGTPETMQRDPVYADVVGEVRAFLESRAKAAEAAGLPREAIALDPGFGFGKRLPHNLALMRALPDLKRLGYPLLVGLSRKSFIGTLTRPPGGEAPAPLDRLEGSLAAAALAVAGGADVLRVHDVRATWRAARVAQAWTGKVQHG